MDSGASSSNSPCPSPSRSSHSPFSSPSRSSPTNNDLPCVRYRSRSPVRHRSPSPIRFPPTVTHESSEVRRTEPFLPWRHPPVAAASPDFDPEPRNFIHGEVKIPQWLSSFSPEDIVMANKWVEMMQVQHKAYVTYHTHLVKELEKTELEMRKLEADPADWEKFSLEKLVPLPMFLPDFCRDLGRGCG